MSYSIYNKVICSNDFVNNYFIDHYPFKKYKIGILNYVKEEYITFNRICGAESVNDYMDRFGAYIYYGRGHSIKQINANTSEVMFATSRYYPIAAIIKAIEIDHSVVWYAVVEELIYLSKFCWRDGKVVELTLNLEMDEFYDWQEDNESLWDSIDECDCEVWHYIDKRDINWIEWECDDLIERYKSNVPIKEYYEKRKRDETIYLQGYKMNLYATLIEQNDNWIDYCFGTSLENMTGLIHIDLNKGTYTIMNYPDEPDEPVNMRNVESLAKRILYLCMSGNIKKKVSREIG